MKFLYWSTMRSRVRIFHSKPLPANKKREYWVLHTKKYAIQGSHAISARYQKFGVTEEASFYHLLFELCETEETRSHIHKVIDERRLWTFAFSLWSQIFGSQKFLESIQSWHENRSLSLVLRCLRVNVKIEAGNQERKYLKWNISNSCLFSILAIK